MIDIHHHLLFGLDDGSPDIDTSIAMAEAAANDGITHIVCTPHANGRFHFYPEINDERLALLRERLNGKITLGLGCDFHLSYDNIEDALHNPNKYTINQKNYLLVEFADLMIPQSMTETFYEMMLIGMRPIITHPERNLTIQKHTERMIPWLQEGCLVQVTASSLTGRFGRTAQALAFKFFDNNWVHIIATDAHNLISRIPIMSEAYKVIENRYGKETAERVCVTNPGAAFHGTELPAQPEPLGLFEQPVSQQKKGFFSRFFAPK